MDLKINIIVFFYSQKDITQQSYSSLFDYPSTNTLNNPSTTNLYSHFETMNSTNRKINLPKTFTTKKGPLILFSEEPTLIAPPHSLNTTHLSLFKQPKETPRAPSKYTETKATNNPYNDFKTIGDLRKSILEFGSNDVSAQDTKRDINEEDMSMPILERKNSFESMSFNKINHDEQSDPKIRPGLSAKRYLSNWKRHWKPQLYESLATKGAIKRDNFFEPNLMSSNSRQRIDDDITLIPPAYRIQRQWLSSNVAPLKVYRFYRAQTNFLGNGIVYLFF